MTVRSKKATVQGARRVTAGLDNFASLFQSNHEALGIPQKVAMDFALRCDMLSDAIERGFSIRNAAFDPSSIGKEVPGPLVSDSNNPFMTGEFTQERFNALAQKQMSGELASNAAGQTADPKLAAYVAKEAAKLAFTILKDRAAKQAAEKADEPKEEEAPKKEAKKSEDDAETKDDESKEDESEEADKSASSFGLFDSK
jgi:hypothetical protein